MIQRDEDADAWATYVEENREAFQNLSSDTFEAIATFTRTGKLLENKDIYEEEGECVDMCKAMDDLMARSEERGMKLGEERGKELGKTEMFQLIQCMTADGLADMIPRIAEEPTFYLEMIRKYQIVV